MCNVTHPKSSILPGIKGFLRKYSREFKKDVRDISRGALPALQAYVLRALPPAAGEGRP